MMRPPLRRLLLWALALLLVVSPAAADTAAELRQRGKEVFERAQGLLEKGEPARVLFVQSAELFERSDAQAPRNEVKFNAAVAWDNAGDLPHAAELFERAIRGGGLKRDFVTWAERRLDDLRPKLSRVVLHNPAGAKVSASHVWERPIPTFFYLQPGRHTLRVRCPGGAQTELVLDLAPGQLGTAAVDCEAPTAPTAALPMVTAPTTPSQSATEEPGPSTGKVLGWAGLSVGVALGVTAVVLGAETLAARDDFEASNNTDADALDRGKTLRLWTNVAAFSALTIGAAGLVAVVVSWDDSKRPASTVGLQLAPTWVGAKMSF